jgi:hypothetical protein
VSDNPVGTTGIELVFGTDRDLPGKESSERMSSPLAKGSTKDVSQASRPGKERKSSSWVECFVCRAKLSNRSVERERPGVICRFKGDD